MVKANELRIGNLIWYGEGTDVEVIGGSSIELLEAVAVEAAMPIPLNAEWLERFGLIPEVYKGDEVEKTEVNCDFDLTVNNDEDFITYWYKRARIKIKYVHQLQNLFFSLTGEELQIKTPEKQG